MMVNSISSVRFCGDADSILSRPGKFSNPAQQTENPTTTQEAEKKTSGSTGKKVVGTIATLAVLAAALVALPKIFPNAIKTLGDDALKNAKWTEKIGHYLAKTGEAIGKYTYEPIVKLFSKNKKPQTPPADSKFFA